jgi:hypothetical protein
MLSGPRPQMGDPTWRDGPGRGRLVAQPFPGLELGGDVNAPFTRSLADGGGDRPWVRLRQFDRRERRKRDGRVREPVEAGPGGGNDRRRNLAAVSFAMPHARKQRRRAILRNIRTCAGSGPSARASHAVRLSVPMVAAVGSGLRAGDERQRALGPPGRRIHDRIGGPRPLPSRHRRVGQHPVASLSLLGNPLLRAHQTGRVHVRG